MAYQVKEANKMSGIEIPNSWMGKPVEGSLERILTRKPASPPLPVTTSGVPRTFQVSNPSDYIVVPQYDILIAKRETHQGKNWQESIELLAQEGRYMPRIDEFMQHFLNMRDAVAGRMILHDGAGAIINQAEIQSQWNYLSSTDRTPFGNSAWTWLDALFKKDGAGTLYLETNHRVTNSVLTSQNVPLVPHATTNGFAPLSSLNNQKLPIDTPDKNYVQGQNIYFWPPTENLVAGFGAGSDRASLDCGRDPTDRDAELGVFACVAGGAPRNSGGSP